LAFENLKVDQEKAIEQALKSLGAMPLELKYQRSTYIVHILWALELAFRAGLPAARASAIAEIINIYGKWEVFGPNVAKFLRLQKQSGEYAHRWNEEQDGYYSINQSGRDFLFSLIDKKNTEPKNHSGE